MSTPWPMHRKLMLAFGTFALVVAALFGTYAVLFAYVVEDEFFNDALRDEAAAQQVHRDRTGSWMPPRAGYMRVYGNPASFPPDLLDAYRARPAASEHAGDAGRHYHLLRLSQAKGDTPAAFLVAEVHRQLIVRRVRGNILELLAWSALGVVALALLVGYWLARRMAAPLEALAQRVETMQPNESLHGFARQFATREVGVLAHGLESLTARVHTFVEREREFTRDASHELRTPLAVINSACERLARDASLSVEARRQVDFLKQCAWQLQQTLAGLLSLAREENAALPAESLVVLPLLEQVVVEQSVLLEGKPVEVTVDVPRDARVTLPSAVLRIILGNLVGNAFAHTAAGWVHIDVDDGRLRITNTQGMDGVMGDSLYQPFAKGEASAGLGLGLAIVRRLCDRHGVDLRIDTDPRKTITSFPLDGAIAAS